MVTKHRYHECKGHQFIMTFPVLKRVTLEAIPIHSRTGKGIWKDILGLFEFIQNKTSCRHEVKQTG